MFLVRSAFWLGLAFIVIKPVDIDLKASANAASEIATNAGKQIIIDQLTSNQCDNMQCGSGKILTLAQATFANDKLLINKPNNISLSEKNTPIPRPRINRDS